jgi:putative two-component system response regulator
VWDTLLSNRPYRKAWQRQQAYQYLQEASGRKFDPHVVDVFFSMIVEKPVVRE